MTPELEAAMQFVATAVNERNRLTRELEKMREQVEYQRQEAEGERDMRWGVESERDKLRRDLESAKDRAQTNQKRAEEWRAEVEKLHVILRENGVAGPWSKEEPGHTDRRDLNG